MSTATKKALIKTGGTPANGSPDNKPLVARQPQSKKEAALKAGMFLHVDDKWSLAYFNEGDLHCMERKLFG
jgi:hypothetical protein